MNFPNVLIVVFAVGAGIAVLIGIGWLGGRLAEWFTGAKPNNDSSFIPKP